MNLIKHNNRSKDQKQKKKPCEFPGCKKTFIGRGRTKYCDEHRKAKYRKKLYRKFASDGVGEANIEIQHKSEIASNSNRVCDLDGCNNEYVITLIPNQKIYPKYCEEHRNKHKRDIFGKNDEN
jgi:hypothetical protein